jgi:hypothetical protein
MLLQYIRRVFTKNIVVAYFIIDTLGFIFLGRQLPWYIYPASLIGGLLVGGYLVFAETARELQHISMTSPQLAIYFERTPSPSKTSDVQVVKLPPEPDVDEAIPRKREELIQKWEAFKPPELPASANLMVRLSRPDRDAYLASVNAYLREYRTYLNARHQFDIADAAIRPFPIVLKNTGSVPAERVTIQISLPHPHLLPSDENILWHMFEREDMPKPPKEPDPSEGAISALVGSLSSLSNIAAMTPYLEPDRDRPPSNTEGPIYDRETHSIIYRAHEVIHNIGESDFAPFVLWLGNMPQDTQLRLGVKIHAANVPLPSDDELRIDVRVIPFEAKAPKAA